MLFVLFSAVLRLATFPSKLFVNGETLIFQFGEIRNILEKVAKGFAHENSKSRCLGGLSVTPEG